MNSEKMREYNDILNWIDAQLELLSNEEITKDEFAEEWDKFIPGLRSLELDENGDIVSFTASTFAKDMKNKSH